MLFAISSKQRREQTLYNLYLLSWKCILTSFGTLGLVMTFAFSKDEHFSSCTFYLGFDTQRLLVKNRRLVKIIEFIETKDDTCEECGYAIMVIGS